MPPTIPLAAFVVGATMTAAFILLGWAHRIRSQHESARVSVVGDSLQLTVGPGTVVWPLEHWDGDVFTFEPFSENAPLGSVSQATFDGEHLVIELLNEHKLGTFTRAG